MSQDVAEAPSSRPALLRMVVLAVVLVEVGVLMDRLGVRDMLDTHWVDAQIKGQGGLGIGLFLLVGAASMAVGVPRQVSAFLAGYAFGVVQGSLLATLAAVIAATGSFFYARHMGRDFLIQRFPKLAGWLDQFLSRNTFSMILALRLVPFSSNLATNLGAGVSGAAFVPFLAASLVGYVPQTVAFAVLGQGISIDPMVNVAMVVGLIGLSSLLGLHMWRSNKRQGTVDAAD